MRWNDHSKEMPDGMHSFLSPSNHAWFNYSDEKLTEVYGNKLAAIRGTRLHDLAAHLIRLQVRLPDEPITLNMYVNDTINFSMSPERKLYYSKYCNGTADAIGIYNNILRVHDLKTGKTPTSFLQLELYTALFFLDYPEIRPSDLDGIELRIYQQNEIRVENPELDTILPMMDKIVHFSKLLKILEGEYGDGTIDSFRSSSR